MPWQLLWVSHSSGFLISTCEGCANTLANPRVFSSQRAFIKTTIPDLWFLLWAVPSHLGPATISSPKGPVEGVSCTRALILEWIIPLHVITKQALLFPNQYSHRVGLMPMLGRQGLFQTVIQGCSQASMFWLSGICGKKCQNNNGLKHNLGK